MALKPRPNICSLSPFVLSLSVFPHTTLLIWFFPLSLSCSLSHLCLIFIALQKSLHFTHLTFLQTSLIAASAVAGSDKLSLLGCCTTLFTVTSTFPLQENAGNYCMQTHHVDRKTPVRAQWRKKCQLQLHVHICCVYMWVLLCNLSQYKLFVVERPINPLGSVMSISFKTKPTPVGPSLFSVFRLRK